MKRIYDIMIVLLLVNPAFGQDNKPCVPCLPQGITFSTQTEIDNFPTNYPDCTHIQGEVKISGEYITNLNGLSSLLFIGGKLWILSNPALTSLTGLANLTSTGTLSISENDILNGLTGLENLTSIEGYVSIFNNDLLNDLTGLDNLTTIGGIFDILYDDGLTSLTGLNSLTTIGYGLNIEINDNLSSLTGLDNIDAGAISTLSFGAVINHYHLTA
jgi:hypothetical protein